MRTAVLALGALACLGAPAQAEIASYYGKRIGGSAYGIWREVQSQRHDCCASGPCASERGSELRTPAMAGPWWFASMTAGRS